MITYSQQTKINFVCIKTEEFNSESMNTAGHKKFSKKVKGKIQVLQKMETADREKLSRDLFSICEQVFGNITYDEFCHYISFSEAKKTYLKIYKNTKGENVGFFALHLFEKEVNGKRVLIFRGQTGLLHDYRRKKTNMYFPYLSFCGIAFVIHLLQSIVF